MKILITNNTLHQRGGAESFLRDLTGDLQSLGHTVAAYTTTPQEGKSPSQARAFPPAVDLENLPFTPDIIHAQHHLDAMTALISLPHVPAIYHCHGAVWTEAVPKHPRIYRYLAMSRTLAQRISVENNILPSNIDIFLNGVDTKRFSTVRKLPEQPQRALFYNKYHYANSHTVLAAEAAADALGMKLDKIGRRLGKIIDNPEDVLPTYDIVFASGRSAIEAVACGCAVVVVGRTSCGEMVQPDNFDRYRQVNFSIAVNSPPPCPKEIVGQLRRYSSSRCARVTERLRIEADSRASVGFLVKLYERVIKQHAKQETGARSELPAISRYLRRLVPVVQITDNIEMQGKPGSKASVIRDLQAQLALVSQGLKVPPNHSKTV